MPESHTHEVRGETRANMRALTTKHILEAVDVYDKVGFDELKKQFPRFVRSVGSQKLYFENKGPFAHRILIALAFNLQDPRQTKLTPSHFRDTDERNHLLTIKGFHLVHEGKK